MAMIPSMFGGRRSSSIFDPLSFDIWDPFEGTGTLLPSVPRETSAFATAQIDWRETPEAHIFKADLPGLRKEGVKGEVEDGRVLKISGERTREQEEKNDKWYRVEWSTGKFLRRLRLLGNARIDQVKASLENGVLNVIVPKEKERVPKVKAIDIAG